MASTGGTGDSKYGFNHLLDGQFPDQPIIESGDLEFYGELLKNDKLRAAMGFKDAEAIEKLIRRKSEYLAFAAELLTEDDPLSHEIRRIYGNDERRLAEDLFRASKETANLGQLGLIMGKIGKSALASDPDALKDGGKSKYGGMASMIGVVKKQLDAIGKP